MRVRLTKLAAGLVAVAALAVGGSTLASAGSKANPPGTPPAADAPGQASETAGEQPGPETEQAAVVYRRNDGDVGLIDAG